MLFLSFHCLYSNSQKRDRRVGPERRRSACAARMPSRRRVARERAASPRRTRGRVYRRWFSKCSWRPVRRRTKQLLYRSSVASLNSYRRDYSYRQRCRRSSSDAAGDARAASRARTSARRQPLGEALRALRRALLRVERVQRKLSRSFRERLCRRIGTQRLRDFPSLLLRSAHSYINTSTCNLTLQ